MGLEAKCIGRLDGERLGEGKSHCGDLELEFRGPSRVKFLWKDISSVSAQRGVLRAESAGKVLELELGEQAEKWAQAILNPKSLVDKFGLKAEHRYSILGELPGILVEDIESRSGPASPSPVNVVFLRMHTQVDLSQLESAKSMIPKDGMVWVIYPKGQKQFRDSDIRRYALENGWVDVKIASVDADLTSIKLVTPKHLR